MISKFKILSILLSVAIFATFSSCKKDDDTVPKPTISGVEYGSSHDNPEDHQATAGDNMHLEAEILAEGKINYITVEIHPEGEEEHEEAEHDHHHEGWEYDSTYTEGFSGLKNATFHKHIDIPASAEPGHYHLHFIVVDMEGNQSIFEGEIEILEAESNIAVTNLTINGGEHDVSKASGSFIIAFDAAVEAGTLSKYSIEIHNHPESGLEADEFKIVDSEFTENFDGLSTASISETIAVDATAPLEEYHVEIIITDSDAHTKTVSGHIDLVQ